MPWGWLFLSHNGDSPYAVEDRKVLMEQGVALSTTSDSEIILQQMGLARTEDLLTALRAGLRSYRGTYALCMLTMHKGEVLLIAARDPSGNRPLSLGRLGGGYVAASEDSAFEVINAIYERDIEPGEIVIISQNSIDSFRINDTVGQEPLFQCIYEQGYFSLPTSKVFGIPVVEFRKELGSRLANHYGGLIKPDDIITYVPDSSNMFAEGFCETLGRKLTTIFIRRHSSGRSFTKESQAVIEETLNVKFSFFRSVIRKILEENPDARVWIVDDSIVRGTTIRKIIRVLRSFGFKFVGVLSGMPPLLGDCGKGILSPETSPSGRGPRKRSAS
jgi:amidophosphoribosyltransferase